MASEPLMMLSPRTVLALVLLAGLLAGCNASEDMARSEEEVSRFHRLMAAGKSHEIYLDSADDLKNAASEQDFSKLLQTISAKLGPYRSSERLSWHVNYLASGTYVALVFQSKFERGPATEQFMYRISDQGPLLAGYHINANALVLN